jgi:hypothetical protein
MVSVKQNINSPVYHCTNNIGQAKDYTIGICCFSAKHATLKRKSKD